MSKIKKGDTVKVLAGNYKGKIGKVLSFKSTDKCVVEGINIRKKAVKRQAEGDTGFTEVFAPIHISNVALVVEHENKNIAVRLKARLLENRKELYYKVGDAAFVYRTISVKNKKEKAGL